MKMSSTNYHADQDRRVVRSIYAANDGQISIDKNKKYYYKEMHPCIQII